jgi:quinol monooxygenase YgiN
MTVRLVVTLTAAPGKGAELAKAFKTRAAEVIKEAGCEQFDVFQGVANTDQVVLLERWADQAALDAHARLNSTRPPIPAELRIGNGAREDYQYNRTR